MGRTLPLARWPSAPGDYLNQRDGNSKYKFSHYPLTSVGYGEPSFAAYYPSCYSVFGFCDIDPGLKEDVSYVYQVIGWFNEADLDPLESAEFAALANDAARYQALTHEYPLVSQRGRDEEAVPGAHPVLGSLTVTPAKVKPWQPQDGPCRLAIGNTGGEALAALLADEVATPQHPDQKALIEDQLEAMNVASSLQGVEVDYAAHVAQTRHQRGLRGQAGGADGPCFQKAR